MNFYKVLNMSPVIELKSSESLKRYITFLLEGFLDNFVYTNIKLAHEYKLPVMKQIEGLSEARISNLFEIGIKGFFEDIINDLLLEGVVRNINDWKNKTKATEITSISYNDLIIGYQIRKQALVQYIDYYSSEPQEFIVLLEELN